MENNKKRNEYDRKYKKEHYKRIEILCKPADADLITDYCKDSGINSKSAYIVNCVKYCIDNNIDVMWLYHNARKSYYKAIQGTLYYYIGIYVYFYKWVI